MTEKNYRKILQSFLLIGLLASCGAEQSANKSDASQEISFLKTWKISGDDVIAALVPDGIEADQIKILAKKECGTREFCKVFVWQSEGDAARAFPMTDDEVRNQIFAYSVNRSTGFEESLWSCDKFPRSETHDCISFDN